MLAWWMTRPRSAICGLPVTGNHQHRRARCCIMGHGPTCSACPPSVPAAGGVRQHGHAHCHCAHARPRWHQPHHQRHRLRPRGRSLQGGPCYSCRVWMRIWLHASAASPAASAPAPWSRPTICSLELHNNVLRARSSGHGPSVVVVTSTPWCSCTPSCCPAQPCQHGLASAIPSLQAIDSLVRCIAARSSAYPRTLTSLSIACCSPQAIDSLVRVQAELLDYSVNSVTGEAPY